MSIFVINMFYGFVKKLCFANWVVQIEIFAQFSYIITSMDNFDSQYFSPSLAEDFLFC